MRKLSRSLAVLLLADRDSAQEAAMILSKEGLWERAIELAILWRVIPQFRRRLRELKIQLAPEHLTRLQEASVVGTAQSVACLNHAVNTIRLLQESGIEAAVFKGIGLMGNLYAGPSERMVTDVDILIDGTNLKKALESIASSSASFTPSDLVVYVDFLKKNSYHRLDNDFLYLTSEDGIKIDLQWSFGAQPPLAMEAARILQRTQRVNLLGTAIHVPAPADAIAISAHHAMRNNFTPASTLKDLCDIMAWWRVEGKAWEIDGVVMHLRECRLSAPTMALWALLRDFDAESPAILGLNEFQKRATAEEIRDSRHLQMSLTLQLDGAALNADLLRIVIDPMWIKGHIVNKVRTIVEGATDLRSHGETDVPSMSRRGQMLFREIFRLNLKRLECYAAMKRSEHTYANHTSRHFELKPRYGSTEQVMDHG